MLKDGIYENLISILVKNELDRVSDKKFIQKSPVDADEATRLLTLYLSEIIERSLESAKNQGKGILGQVEIVNKILNAIGSDEVYKPYIYVEQGKTVEKLLALVNKENVINFTERGYPVERPISSISRSSLFTGSEREPSMYSELKKEILSSDRVDMLVSFIKWSGMRLLINELNTFTMKGGMLRIITTTYMGVTDMKSIEELSKLPNTSIKISYETKRTRLHAKTYIFHRETGFSTAYVGSSNLSNAAMSSGLEWNVKITEKDLPETMEKVNATFESYWNSEDFELYSNTQKGKLENAINSEKHGNESKARFISDVHPYAYQQNILDILDAEREVHGRFKNLVVAATGTGKTVISALDYRRFCSRNPGKPNHLLFIAHRKEILEQSIDCFRSVLRDYNFGELSVGNSVPTEPDHLFMSIQMFNSRELTNYTNPEFYDFIIVDEFHHAAAPSYEKLLSYFKPKILLGLTATPERMDGQNILQYFDNHISVEIRLPEAIERKLLSPFQYFGITDIIDLNTLKWSRGGYDRNDLSTVYTNGNRSSMERVSLIVDSLMKYVDDINKVKGLGFCVSKQHCKFMAEQFNSYGITSVYITSDSSDEERESATKMLAGGEIKFVFAVDIYNEGVDIPQINTVLFLRPTESLTVFLQQLGRGLRLWEDKDCLTVLDFVGQANKNYNFREKFSAILSKNSRGLVSEINEGFPDVPTGCYIQLEKKAQEYILNNIRQSVGSRSMIISRISTFSADSGLPLTLENFLEFYHMDPKDIYWKYSFSRLKVDAGVEPDFTESLEPVITKAFSKLCSIDSRRWINFLLNMLKNADKMDLSHLSPLEIRMCNMFQFTVWKKSYSECGFNSPEEGILKIRKMGPLTKELIELLEFRLSRIDFVDRPVNIGFECPLDLHCSYTRDQILVAMDFMNPTNVREGVKYLPDLNIDLLFVTLNKLEKDYSPSTLYRDYSISDTLFHWQSQSTTSESSATGQRYINHKSMGCRILLFVRENKKDSNGSVPYTYLGPVEYVSHEGSNPISIVWRLQNPIPARYLEITGKTIPA
jgi:superfamily II DNA or RNA helicase